MNYPCQADVPHNLDNFPQNSKEAQVLSELPQNTI